VNHDDSIRRLATITDEQAARTVTGETKADLAEQIMATAPGPAPARRRRILLFGVPLAVAAAGAAAVAVWAGVPGRSHPAPPVYAPRQPVQLAALSFSTQGKYLIVKVKDPYADPKRYAKEFAEHGMKIQLKMVPASPSIVGTVVMMEDGVGIKTITAKGKCWTGGGGDACPVGVRIPIGYQRSASIVFGREARPGEPYASTTSAFAAGEELHCVDIRGRTVSAAIALLRRHKMSVALYNYESRPGWFENTRDPGKIPGGWYVSGAEPYAPGQVQLMVQRAKPGHAKDEAYYRQMFKGCH
jgi:hypothetical protein